MMHIVIPGKTGGPNVSVSRIMNSGLNEKFDFIPLNQNRAPGGKLNIGLIRELRDQIKNKKPDIVHVSGLQSAGFHCAMAAKLAGCKHILVSIRGFSGDAINFPASKRWVFNNIVEPLTLKIADKVHGISKYTVEQPMVKKYAKGKAIHIYNLPPIVNNDVVLNDIRDELDLYKDDVLVSTVGRITVDKGFYELAGAIKQLKDIPNLKFIIVGDGNYSNTFAKLVKDEITLGKTFMLGKRNDVLEIMKACDIFALPSLHENLGNVFIEASLVKTAIIGTNVGGVPEIIMNQLTGLLIPPSDSKALADAIMYLYENPNIRKEYGEKAFQRINTIFSVKKLENQFYKLYNSLIESLQ